MENVTVPGGMDVLKDVAEQIKNSQPEVRKRLVAVLVDRELDNRVSLLDKALTKRAECERELHKARPDQISYDVDGRVVSENYSKAKFEERKKLLEQQNKLETALTGALGGDFKKLKEILC